MREVGVGIVGFGTVGAGVADGLLRNAALIARRCGLSVALRGVADLDITRDRGVAVPRALLTTDALGLATRGDVDIVVELIGGTGVADEVIRAALKAGKSVVTANKKLLAEKGAELFALAREKGADLYFGASVGGGIPIVRALRDGLVANEIRSITKTDHNIQFLNINLIFIDQQVHRNRDDVAFHQDLGTIIFDRLANHGPYGDRHLLSSEELHGSTTLWR